MGKDSKNSKTYNSIEEINEHRKELDKKYDDGLPKYLIDFFDNEVDKFKKREFYRNRAIQRYKYSNEDKKKYYKERDEEFWKTNKYELIKKEKRLGKHLDSVYKEPDRNTKILDDEKDLSPEDIKMLIAMCEEDLYLFAIRYFSHYLKQPSSEFHKYIYNFLTNNINQRKKYSRGFKHAIAAPRSNAKSSVISTILPLWCIAYNKKKFIIIISDTVDQAIDFLSDVKREIDHNVLLQRDFPHIVGKGPTWKQDEIITNNDIKLMALGTKSKVRGRKYGIHRPDLICGDDLENSAMVRSEAEREWIRYQWFNKDLLHVHGEKGTFTDILIVGTILGKEALLTALLDPNEYPDWTSRRFKAVHKFSDSPLWDEWEELYKNRFDENRIDTARQFFEDHKEEMLEGTKVLWPEGDPYYDLMVEKISDYSAFLCFKKGTPILTENNKQVPIEKLKIGDKVLSGSGNYENVTYVSKRKSDSKIVKLKIAGVPDEIEVTEEHPFLIWPKNRIGEIGRINSNKLEWKFAKDLEVGDVTRQPISIRSWIYDEYLYSRIQKVSIEDQGTNIVYGLSVSGNKTYCIPGATVHNSEKQNDPLDPSLILVPLKDIRFENFSQDWIQDIIKNKRNPRYGALDPSLGKKNKKGDYSCITMVIRDLKSGYILVCILDLKRRSVDDQIEAILKYHSKYHYKLFAVETNAFQLVVADTLRKYSRKSGLYVPVKDVIVKNDKKMRFEKHIPIIKDGTVIFDKQRYNNNNMYFKSIEQITTFVGDGRDKNDDAVDGLSLTLDLITQRVFKRRTKQTKR